MDSRLAMVIRFVWNIAVASLLILTIVLIGAAALFVPARFLKEIHHGRKTR